MKFPQMRVAARAKDLLTLLHAAQYGASVVGSVPAVCGHEVSKCSCLRGTELIYRSALKAWRMHNLTVLIEYSGLRWPYSL